MHENKHKLILILPFVYGFAVHFADLKEMVYFYGSQAFAFTFGTRAEWNWIKISK